MEFIIPNPGVATGPGPRGGRGEKRLTEAHGTPSSPSQPPSEGPPRAGELGLGLPPKSLLEPKHEDMEMLSKHHFVIHSFNKHDEASTVPQEMAGRVQLKRFLLFYF